MPIGEALAQARSQAGLTIAEVSQRTRIRETIIRGIEAGDFSACGGDFYARGHIRSIAKVVGTDAEALIREYDGVHRAPGVLSAVSLDELLTSAEPSGQRLPAQTAGQRGPILEAGQHRLNWTAVLALALVVLVGLIGYLLLPGSPPTASSPPAAGGQALNHRSAKRIKTNAAPKTSQSAARAAHAASSAPTPAPPTSAPPTLVAQTLKPVSAVAFGPSGSGQGDNPQLAPLAIDSSPATAWQTDWYTTARFGNLYPGTGLLLDMGRTVTITSARITLGRTPGAGLQLRVGAAASLAGLPTAAHADHAGGVVDLQLGTPARGRYVLLWFTMLPPDPAGTFQVSVNSVRLEGQP